jgi:hypothetical protein
MYFQSPFTWKISQSPGSLSWRIVAFGESTKKLQISTTKMKEKESKKKLKSIAFSRDSCRMCNRENGVGCPRPETTTTYTKTPDKEHSICTFF